MSPRSDRGPTRAPDVDVLVVGSGFGGAVTALRLTEKGYSVRVLEAGRRFADGDHGTSWNLRTFLWAPALGCLGIQRIHPLKDVVVLAGAGVGGGSLVYANTLYEPVKDAFYDDPQWGHITDWKAELAPHYDLASRMLGVTRNPSVTPSDRIMAAVADELGVGSTFTLTPVGVFFGRDGRQEPGVEVPDPYFGGAGPARRGCIECGECMSGCRHNAKNTLTKNYLYLAERAGAHVVERASVVDIVPLPTGGYEVLTEETGPRLPGRRARRTAHRAEQVVVAAGTWGTLHLLTRLRATGRLPGLSDRLGHLTRTNSEALCGATTGLRHSPEDYTRGIAITSSFHPDEHTHVEPVRYGKGSNFMALLTTPMTDGGGRLPRPVRWVGQVLRHPGRLLGIYAGIRRWSERTVVGLVMQTSDNSLVVSGRRSRLLGWRLSSRQGHGVPNPTWIPAANATLRAVARHMGGYPMSSLGEIADIPMTAHFLGGAVIGQGPDTGVIDAYHRAYGHPGLHIVGGAAISANLGVNPSLTITAQAERAMALWPNRGEVDRRPPLGAPYVRVPTVPPRHPAVPAWALRGADRRAAAGPAPVPA